MEQKVFTTSEREPVNNEGSTIFDQEHYIGTIAPTEKEQVIRSLLESVFNSCYISLIEWTLCYFVIYRCMKTTVCYNNTVQFTFFLVMRLNITTVKRCDTLIVITCTFFSSIKLEYRLK